MMGRRGVKGAKRIDAQAMRAMIGQQQMTTSLGVVRKFPGETSHFEVDTENGTNEIMVDVELIPSGEKVLCRLGFGDEGVFRIPREGAEVAVLIPYNSASLVKDSLDYEGIIVGILNVNAPSQLSDVDTLVIVAPKVKVISADIELGDSPDAQDGVVVGSGIDSFTGLTYFAMTNTSTIVKAKR